MTAEFTTHEPSYVFRGQPTMLVRLPEAAVAALRASPRVRSVSRGRPLELHAEQTGWHFAGYPQGHRLLALQDTAVGQGAQGTDGSDVGIAIIDSGVDCFNLNNVDMYQACAGGYNFTLDPGPYYDAVRDPSTGQVSHHGTSVASVINAIIKNSVGVRGAAPGALVYSLKIFSSVIGDYPDCNRSAAAIDYATFTLSAEVAIINLSYGSWSGSDSSGYAADCEAEIDAIYSAWVTGRFVAAATGNSSTNVAFPARLNGVAATSGIECCWLGAAKPWPNSNIGSQVKFAAAAHNVYTVGPNGTVLSRAGTSFAAPLAAAIAAIVQSANPESPLHGQCILLHLQNTAQSVLGGSSTEVGAGMLDAYTAWGTSLPTQEFWCQQPREG